MGEKEIKEEYEHFKHDIEKVAEDEIRKIKKKIRNLEEEAGKIGKETENVLSNDRKVESKADKH